MNNSSPEFDQYSEAYDQLASDEIRDRFASGATEFFHLRKRDLIREYFRKRETDTRTLAYLDLGCGKGELATMLRDDFARVAGCDPSAGMLKAGGLAEKGIEARVQGDPGRIPFEPGEFDFVTAVCVFHHVPPMARASLVKEARRVLKPGGTLAIIEHNTYNPVTRLAVSRIPVDADAILLPPPETRNLFRNAQLTIDKQQYFLYFPAKLYPHLRGIEAALSKVPLGGQYAVFGRLP
jgi:SAM-dependent methyltransferase